ncbi:hypothetical protein HPP92_010562 [Vanilla planifolia]|uniref:Uncharacterized protein n=1 Tax=Vanilla planifolia TaxID=51239 RepID=A0A835QVY3_VANPL|nr:hypothetical protein HPP92_010562 [Vanilla planifolia]
MSNSEKTTAERNGERATLRRDRYKLEERRKSFGTLQVAMGSLMAGWDSPFLDPDTARIERNRSLTREEIKAFRRKNTKVCRRREESKSDSRQSQRSMVVDKFDAENITGDWWTKSDWAFLNEPPLDETGKTYSYASQFHVAEMTTRKH